MFVIASPGFAVSVLLPVVLSTITVSLPLVIRKWRALAGVRYLEINLSSSSMSIKYYLTCTTT